MEFLTSVDDIPPVCLRLAFWHLDIYRKVSLNWIKYQFYKGGLFSMDFSESELYSIIKS